MDNRETNHATKVLSGHKYGGGLDLGSVYGKKQPSQTSTEGSSAGPYGHESSSAGPYGGPDYVSPYVKPAANATTEGYSESSRPHAAAPPAYGRPSSGYGEEDAAPGYGRKPDHGGEHATIDYGRKPGYSGEHEGSDYGRKPGYGGEHEASDYGRKPGYGGEYDTIDYGRKPGYGGEHETSDYGRKPGYGGEYDTSDYGRKPGYGGEHESSDYGRKPGYGGEYGIEGHSTEGGGYGRKPAAGAYVESENFANRPPYEGEYSAGRIPEGGGRRPHRYPESGFSEYEAPRPTGYGSAGPFKHGNPYEEEDERRKPHFPAPAGYDFEGGRPSPSYGRPDEDDRLASHTAGLSLGGDGHGGRRAEGHRPKRDDSADSSDDEKKRHNKHKEKHEHHHRKHDDDDY